MRKNITKVYNTCVDICMFYGWLQSYAASYTGSL